mmetsp:Transcript_58698/g.139776  ORF Transcript_58698/g.139776 Transcript_58698/m.139776 type:complete len:556 (-) Transcript_58698:504-2171(-)
MGAQVPKQEVIVRAIASQLVALSHKGLCQRLGVRLHRASVVLEHGRVHLQELSGQGTDLVVVRTTLKGREHGHVDALLDVRDLVRVLEEDHASPWASQGLVGRGRHHVAEREGRGVEAGGNQPGDVRDVCHEVCAHLVRNLPELGKVDHARISRSTTQDHGRTEDQRRLTQLIEVDEPCLRVHAVRQRLKVDGRGTDLLLGRVVAVGEVPAARQVQAHDAGMGRQQGSVDGKIGWAARVGLHVDAPLLLIQAESLQGPILAQVLHLVNDLVATVVAVSWLTLGVFVGQRRPKALHHSPGGKVLRGNQLDASHLPGLLLLHQLVHRRVCLHQRAVARQCWPVAGLCARGDALGRHHEFGIRLDCLEGCCLGIADLSQALENTNDDFLQVQGVEVQTRRSTLQQCFAHGHALLDAKLLESLIGSVSLLRPFHEALGHARLAKLRHPLQPTQTIQAHDAGHDRHLDVILTAFLDELQENLGIQEHLSNDEAGTGIDLLLQIHHLLVEIGIAADGHSLFAGGILHHSCPSLFGLGQSCHPAFNRLNVVGVPFRIACHGD